MIGVLVYFLNIINDFLYFLYFYSQALTLHNIRQSKVNYCWCFSFLSNIYQYFFEDVVATSSTPLSRQSQYIMFESRPVYITSFVATIRYAESFPDSENKHFDCFSHILSKEYITIYLLETHENYFSSIEKHIS